MATNTLTSKFITWYFNELQESSFFKTLRFVKENSPWHREENVAIHTNMVVTEFLARNEIEKVNTLLPLLACVFHDFGKPTALINKHTEERGDYVAFPGHEGKSARLWEHYACKNWKTLVDIFGLDPIDIYRVSWLIEQHLPYGLKNPEKLRRLKLTTKALYFDTRALTSVLKADAYGRISDDRDKKLERVDDWCSMFLTLAESEADTQLLLNAYPTSDRTIMFKKESDEQPTLIIPIAPSGAGKSTTFEQTKEELDGPLHSFSMDELRLKWYSEDYAEAFKLSCDDSTFENKVKAEFSDLIAKGENIYVDNTNLSKKRRAFYVNAGRQHGYYIAAVLFPSTITQVKERQESRDDKTVPETVAYNQYMSLQLPQFGEFDAVRVVDSNMT